MSRGVAALPDADAVHALLPQTQCTRCGYAGCRPYAEAIAAGVADINRCPPGGEATLVRLAALTGRPARPIDPECGMAGPPMVAVIDAARCIGCARCLPPCPVDAIVGAPRAFDAATDRKALSRDLEQEVRRLMKGRPLSSPSLPDDGAVTVTPPSARDREPLAG